MAHALLSDDRVGELWRLQTEATPMALAVEFIALANHRKAIKAEIATYADHARDLQAAAISPLLEKSTIDPRICPPLCFTTVLAGVARALIMEQSVGISRGHAETLSFVTRMLKQFPAPHGAAGTTAESNHSSSPSASEP